MNPRPLLLAFLLVAPALAGCLDSALVEPGSTSGTGGGSSAADGFPTGPAPSGPRQVVETKVERREHDGTLTGSALVEPASDMATARFSVDVPRNASRLEALLEWDNPSVDLDLVARAPDGRETGDTGGAPGFGSSPVRLSVVEGLIAGEWVLEVTTSAAAAQPFRLTVETHHQVLVDLPASAPAASAKDAGRPSTTAQDSDVVVERDGNRFRASRTVQYDTDLAGVDAIEAVLKTVNGAVVAEAVPGETARFTGVLWAAAATEEAARKALEGLRFHHETERDGSGATVLAEGRVMDGGDWSNRGVHVSALLPEDARHDLAADTRNGPVRIVGLEGGAIRAEASNGPVQLRNVRADEAVAATSNGPVDLDDVRVGRLFVDTSNGPVTGSAVADDAEVATSNGPITLRLEGANPGAWDLGTSNGPVRLTIPEDSTRGYELEAETSRHERVDVDLRDVDVVAEEKHHKHVRTRGYEDRDVRTTVRIETSNGSITVRPA